MSTNDMLKFLILKNRIKDLEEIVKFQNLYPSYLNYEGEQVELDLKTNEEIKLNIFKEEFNKLTKKFDEQFI